MSPIDCNAVTLINWLADSLYQASTELRYLQMVWAGFSFVYCLVIRGSTGVPIFLFYCFTP